MVFPDGTAGYKLLWSSLKAFGLTLPHPHRRILTSGCEHRSLWMPINPHNLTICRQIRQKLPIPPFFGPRLFTRRRTTPSSPPDPHFTVHSTGSDHFPVGGELDIDNGIFVARQEDRFECRTVEWELRGVRGVGHGWQGTEDVGVVIFASRDGEWRIWE